MAGEREDTAPLLLGVVITTLGLQSIFIFARTISRAVIRPQFGWDDVLIIITWAIVVGYNTAVFVGISRGYGKHIYDLTTHQYTSAIEANVVSQVLAIASFPTGKASIAYLLLRIFPAKRLRWILWSFVTVNALLFYALAILILVQCQPVAFQWDQSIEGGACWSPKVVVDFGWLTAVVGALTAFVFAILPWFYISKLQMSLKEKLSVGTALSMGFFAGVCSVLKMIYTANLGDRADYTFNSTPLVLWSCAEIALTNIAACIPTLRPLYIWIIGSERHTDPPAPWNAHASMSRASAVLPWRLSRHSRGSQRLRSPVDYDRNIYQSKSYEVSVRYPEDEDPASSSSAAAVVNKHHSKAWSPTREGSSSVSTTVRPNPFDAEKHASNV